MEEDNNKVLKFSILRPIANLLAFNALYEKSDKIRFIGELEITPYQQFNSEYGSIYWFLQYMLLKNGIFEIERHEIKEEYLVFFSEKNINFEWLCIKGDDNFMICCIDGSWKLEIYTYDLIDIATQFGVALNGLSL